MQPIRTRSDLAQLLERHMAQNTARSAHPAADEDLEVRTALKTYLLEAHGRMRTAPRAALGEVASALGLQITATAEAELIEISFGDITLWLDVSNARFPRMYSIGQVKDTDRVVSALVAGTGLVESVWLPPRTLESLAATTQTGMVLFSLRHDRRPLRRTPDRDGIDSVTLRLWGPRAKDTLDKLRRSEVLPAATSVYSVRLRGGDAERYCLAEVFHTGKITAVGNSFLEHEKMIRSILDERDAWSQRFDAYRTPRKFSVEVPWTVDDLGFAVGKIFGGAEPFRLWGLPEQTSPGTFRVRAVDTDVGRTALFTLTSKSLTIEMPARTPASVLVRFVSNLQYHVNADLSADLIAPEPMLQLGLLDLPGTPAFHELSPLHDVARVILTEACALLLRNQLSLTPAMLVESVLGEVPTEALTALTRKVMSEVAANEWRTRMYPIQGHDGKIAWRFLDPLPVDASARLRELVRMNRLSQQLVARLAGVPVANWLQLSLFGPETLVPPVQQEDVVG